MNKNLCELQKEAKKVAGILRVNCPEIVYDEEVEIAKCTQTSDDDVFCVLLNPELEVDFQLSMVIRFIRMMWAAKKFGTPTIEDACCFEVGYRTYFRKESVQMFYSGNFKVDTIVNSYALDLQNYVAMFGNGFEERCAWLEDARYGMLDY